MPIDPNLAFGFRPTPNVGPDFGGAIQDAQQANALIQQRQKMQSQNALRNILGQPGAIDAMGNPTPDAMARVTAVDPIMGVNLRQNMLVQQQNQTRMDMMRTDLFQKKTAMIADALAPILEEYEMQTGENAGANAKSPEQAQAQAQEATDAAISRLEQGGGLSESEKRNLPRKFDPVQFRQFFSGYEGYQNWLKNQRADHREQREENYQNRELDIRQQTADGDKWTWTNGFGPGPDGTQVPGSWRFPTKQEGEPKFFPHVTQTGKAPAPGSAGAENTAIDADIKKEHPDWSDGQVALERNKRIAANKAPAPGSAAADHVAIDADIKKQHPDWTPGQVTVERIIRTKAANSGPIEVSDEELASIGAQAATGEPLMQIVPGYREGAEALRQKARSEAIKQIRAENPGMTAEQAGQTLAMRAIEYQGGKKSVGQLDQMLGATHQAVGQLDYNVSQVKEDLKKLPSADMSPIINAIVRGEENWTGDPAYSALFFHMHAVAVESARILSGGQASVAQLHQGAMDEAKKWASVNMTPSSFDAVAASMLGEGENRIATYQTAITYMKDRTGNGGASTAPAKTDAAQKGASQSGFYTGDNPPAAYPDAKKAPDGKWYVKKDGDWWVVPSEDGAPAAQPAGGQAVAKPDDMQDGAVVEQGGKRYRKQGTNWVEVQ